MQPQSPTLPVTIKRSLFGLVAIYAVGFAIAIALIVEMAYNLHDPSRDFAGILSIAAVVTLIATLIQAYIYSLSHVTLTQEGLNVTVWASLTLDKNGTTEWRNIQDVTFTKRNIFGLIFDFGTLNIQTAGTERNFKITYVPRVEYWQSVIEQQADTAPMLVHEV